MTENNVAVPKVGVVTVTYNSACVLDDFIASLLAQTHQNFVLYAVDNASRDKSVARLSAVDDPRMRIIANPENYGVAEGNNIGIRQAIQNGCDFILLLNNDTSFPADLFERLLTRLVATQSDMASPKIFYENPSDQVWFGGGYFRRGMAMMADMVGGPDGAPFSRQRLIEYAPTCCVLAKAGVFTIVGEMDPAYFVYWDDADFMLRAWHAGLKLLYAPDAILFHKVSALTGGAQSDFTIRYDTRNLVYYTRKHFRSFSSLWLGVHALRLLLRYLVGRDRWRTLGPRWRAFREGLAMPLPTEGQAMPGRKAPDAGRRFISVVV
jgi:GT2 family glycosyltransferase